MALEAGIACFNVESRQELEIIASLASEAGVKAKVALRVNPNIDAHTHAYITTGLSENKFGISREQLDSVVEFCRSLSSVELIGLHFHIGSQITEPEPFEMLADTINELQDCYNARGIEFKASMWEAASVLTTIIPTPIPSPTLPATSMPLALASS